MSRKESAPERLLRLELEAQQRAERDDEQGKLLREIHAAVHGEGDQPGLKGRVDRLERSQKTAKYVLGLTFATITTWLGFKSIGK